MKKIFSFLLLGLLLSIGNLWAEEVVYKTALFGTTYNSKSVSSYTDTWTATNDGFTVSLANFNNNNNVWNYVKCGRKNNASVGKITTSSAIDQAITKVDITIDAITAVNKVNSIKLYTSSDNSAWTEIGSYTTAIGVQSVSLTSPAVNLYYKMEFDCQSNNANGIVTISKIEFYYDNAGGSQQTVVSTPTFSVAAGTYTSAKAVELSCSTDGATIYYTTDGSNPTTSSSVYSSAISVSTTTTIKAIAVKDGMVNSAIASAEYTIQTPISIASVRAQATGSVFTQGIVTSSSSDGKTVYIQDASAGVVIYSNSDLSLTVGDEITVKGTLSSYHNLLEITSPVVNVLSQGNSVSPAVKTIAEINADNTYSLQGLLIKIENAIVSEINEQNVTLAQSANTIVVRFANASDVTTAGIAVDDVISLVGNIGCYNGAQIANPTDVQIEAPVAVPSIDVEETSINATAEETEGTITVTYNNITNVAAEVIFYNAQGDEVPASTYSWIAAEINDQTNNVDYVVVANTSDERTAYMKVYALDDATNDVYSELITINQAAYVAPAHGSSADDPFSVAEVLAGTATGSNVYVKGYIVGEYVAVPARTSATENGSSAELP